MKINLSLPRLPIEKQWEKPKTAVESPPIFARINPIYGTCCSLLVNRIFGNWRENLMIAGAAFSVIGIAAAFFSGSLFYCVCFGVAALVSVYGAYYMRTQASLNELKDSLESLKAAKERFESLAIELREENLLLKSANQELIKTNDSLKATNEQLLLTNEKLRTQVIELAIIAQNLRESAQEIRNQVASFRTNNTTFDACLKNLEYQLSASQAFNEETTRFLSAEKTGLAERLSDLAALLQEIKANKPTLEKIKELSAVHEKLSGLKGEYAKERGKLEEVVHQSQDEHKKLQTIRAAFSNEQQKLEQLRKAFEKMLRQMPRRTAPPLGLCHA